MHRPERKVPALRIDTDGVCDACRYAERKEKIDWEDRERQLVHTYLFYRSRTIAGADQAQNGFLAKIVSLFVGGGTATQFASLGEVARHRRPDAVELERVRAVHRRQAVRLRTRELQRVALAGSARSGLHLILARVAADTVYLQGIRVRNDRDHRMGHDYTSS